jgi:hypothetical protein
VGRNSRRRASRGKFQDSGHLNVTSLIEPRQMTTHSGYCQREWGSQQGTAAEHAPALWLPKRIIIRCAFKGQAQGRRAPNPVFLGSCCVTAGASFRGTFGACMTDSRLSACLVVSITKTNVPDAIALSSTTLSNMGHDSCDNPTSRP